MENISNNDAIIIITYEVIQKRRITCFLAVYWSILYGIDAFYSCNYVQELKQ